MVYEQPAGPQVSLFHDIDDAEPMGLGLPELSEDAGFRDFRVRIA